MEYTITYVLWVDNTWPSHVFEATKRPVMIVTHSPKLHKVFCLIESR